MKTQKNIKKSYQKQAGITLISLVVTIVVLLILAGISLYYLTGENGIILRSRSAKELTEINHEKEALKTSILQLLGDKKNAILEDTEKDRVRLQNNLEDYTGNTNISVSSAKDEGYIFKVIFEETKRNYYVDSDGEILDTITPRYNVCFYLENIDNSEFSIAKSEIFEISAEGGNTVQISTLVSNTPITGGTFSYATINDSTVTEFTEEQGKTVNLYYTRNSYKLTLSKADNNISSVSGGGTYKYGQNVEISSTLANTV